MRPTSSVLLGSASSRFPFPGDSTSVLEVGLPTPVSSDVPAPPTGPLTRPDETVVTHRLAVSVPIR